MKKGQKIYFLDMLDWEGHECVRTASYLGPSQICAQHIVILPASGTGCGVLPENIFETRAEAKAKLNEILTAKRAAANQ